MTPGGGLPSKVILATVALLVIRLLSLDMSQQGAIYALIIELFVPGYFILLGLGVASKYVR